MNKDYLRKILKINGGIIMDKAQIAKMIDHTILKPEATEKEILKLCKEAVEMVKSVRG